MSVLPFEPRRAATYEAQERERAQSEFECAERLGRSLAQLIANDPDLVSTTADGVRIFIDQTLGANGWDTPIINDAVERGFEAFLTEMRPHLPREGGAT